MAYVDLRPFKPKKKKTVLEDANADASTSVGTSTDTNVESDFFSNLAGVGDTSASASTGTSASQGFSSTAVSSKDDVIEILNLLHEKLSKIEDKIYRMERKLDNIDEKNHSTYGD
ncbi:MAG: hypothetical protein KJ767_00380 [Nanoarchaeota archaeon]|nr:hypothetical protein [Nanoarchaeota archaeon]